MAVAVIAGFRSRLSALIAIPLRAPLPPGGGQKKSSRDKGPRRVAELSKDVATGCGLMKGEADPPLKPDSEYPAWLFELLEPRSTTRELAKAYSENGLTVSELRRLWRLQNKARIREQNMMRSK